MPYCLHGIPYYKILHWLKKFKKQKSTDNLPQVDTQTSTAELKGLVPNGQKHPSTICLSFCICSISSGLKDKQFCIMFFVQSWKIFKKTSKIKPSSYKILVLYTYVDSHVIGTAAPHALQTLCDGQVIAGRNKCFFLKYIVKNLRNNTTFMVVDENGTFPILAAK